MLRMLSSLSYSTRFAASRLPRAAARGAWNITGMRAFSSTVPVWGRIEKVFTPHSVKPVGPYSQAIKANGFVFVSGQIPAESNGTLIEGTVQEKTHKMCQNARAVLEAAGSSLENVVQVTIFFENLDDAKAMNEVYPSYFPHHPARTSCEATRVPVGAGFIMELIAVEGSTK